jgi:shikimate kinase
MKLLFIYGPPAAGKLTVANEIANRTGYRVFHNHLTIDAILPVFEFGTPPFGKLVSMMRAETIAEAARENVDLIYTFCYAKDADDSHIRRITSAVEDNGGEVCFVLLKCSVEELNARVTSQSRAEFKKIQDAETLGTILDRNDLFSTVPDRESLIVDNTSLDPVMAAELIIEHFGLRKW